MPKATPGLISFSAGELSPLLEGRTDVAKYTSGCYALENFIVTVQGPIRRRPGTRYEAPVKNHAHRCWLTPFSFNAAESYILEWGDHYLRFDKNYAPVETAPNVPYEIATPYGIADLTDANGLFQLVYVQSADVVYITHRSKTFPAYKLSRFGDTNWTLTKVDGVGGPFGPINPGNNPVVYASAQTGSGITLTASADIFDADRMGSLFLLQQENIRDIKPWAVGATGITIGQRVRYNGVTYERVGGGTTTGPVPPTHISGRAYDGLAGGTGGVLWEYRDPGYGFVRLKTRGADPAAYTPLAITGITKANPAVVTLTAPPPANGTLIFITGIIGMSEMNDRFFTVSAAAGNTFVPQEYNEAGALANVESTDFDAYVSGGTETTRLWTATADVEEQSATGTVNRLPKIVVGSQNATSLWAYGAWSDHDGYPSVVSFFRGRLAFGRDGDRWFSVSQDFENFSAKTPGGQVTADMAITITEPVEDAVHWMLEGRALLEGTEKGESVIQEINAGQAFGPANIASKRQLRNGARAVIPVVVGNATIYVQTSGRKVRVSEYAFDSDNYESTNIAEFAEHITKSGIIQMAFQKEPDSTIWMARGDGLPIGLTFNKEQQIAGWHRHPLRAGDAVESVASLPSPDGARDDLWMIVRRTINGATKRYKEYLASHFEMGGNVATEAFYQDSGVTFTGPATVVTGLGHLEGETVKVLADGSAHPDRIVSGGQITLDREAVTVQVGLAQKKKITTMPLEAGSATGTAQGKIKRISGVKFRFLDTLGGSAGRDGEPLEAIEFRKPSDPMDGPVPLYTGLWPPDNRMAWPAGYEEEGRLTYEGDDCFPTTIIGIYPTVETND